MGDGVSELGECVGEGEVSEIKKKKNQMGQNTALKTRRLKKRGPTTEKNGRRKDKAQGTREDFNKKLHETPEGEEIYM